MLKLKNDFSYTNYEIGMIKLLKIIIYLHNKKINNNKNVER